MEEPPVQTRMEALNQRVLLVCPSISWWHGMYQLPKTKTEVTSDGKTVNKKSVTTPQAKLMTDEYPKDSEGVAWKKRFTKINSRLSALKERYSLPFPITGVRIVPKARSRNMFNDMVGLTLSRATVLRDEARRMRNASRERMLNESINACLQFAGDTAPRDTPVFDPFRNVQSVAYELYVTANEFCDNWSDIRQQIAQQSDVFDQVESKVPRTAATMRRKFALNITPVELAGGRSNTLTESDLEEHADAVRATCERQVEAAINEMITGPRQQLAKALADLKERVSDDAKLKSNSFNAVREAMSKIRMFDFVANESLMDQIWQLEQRLDTTVASQLTAEAAATNGFAAALDRFIDEVEDAEKQSSDFEEFGRDLRSIDL